VLPAVGLSEVSVGTVLFSAVVATFIYAGASATLQQEQLKQRLPRASVAALARRAVAVTEEVPLAVAVRRAQEADARGVVVVDSTGRPRAGVSEAAVLATPEERRPWVPVGSVARGLVDGMLLDPGLAGEPLVEALRRTPTTEYVVVDGAGFRVLSAADVAEVLTPR